MPNAPIKIAIVTRSLAVGGAERASGFQSIQLSDAGFDVHVITVLDEIEFDYRGKLFNLGILKNKDDSAFGRFERMKAMRKYLRDNGIDWVIDHRPRTSNWSEYIISRWIYHPSKTIFVVHNFKIDKYFPSNRWIAKRIYRKSLLVTVSEEIKNLVADTYGYQNIKTIYNPIDAQRIASLANEQNVSGNFILAYGRIDDSVKNFSLLIDSYAQSVLPQKGIDLYILGDGSDVEKLKAKAAALGLQQQILFKPKQTNPFPYVKTALFTTLTSRYEGFPMVIIESLVLGTPVVSVDCHSGPKEVILNEQNGLLVANENVAELAEAMDRMITDQNLYANCKRQASQSVAHLSMQSVAAQWTKILSSKNEA